jgi:hypothetical protein
MFFSILLAHHRIGAVGGTAIADSERCQPAGVDQIGEV